MKKNHTSFFGENPFTKAFQQFDEDTFFKNLHNQVKDKSYFEKYKGFKDTVLVLSYLFNLASMLTASYAIFWLTKWLTGLVIIAYIVAGVFLFFLEKLKRKSSNEFFQVWFFRKEIAVGWLGLSLCCLGISLFSSAFGTKTGTEELSPSTELIATDSTATAYRNEVTKLKKENEKLSSQTNHEGTIYYKLQSIIGQNTAMIADYNTRILALDKKLEGKNELLSTSYQDQVNLTAWTLVWITILLELFFEACIAYIWYYHYRSYVERNSTELPDANIENEGFDSPNPPNTPITSEQFLELQRELEQIKIALSASKKNVPLLPNQSEISSNGIPKTVTDFENSANTYQRPIGFYTDRQLAEMNISLFEKDKSCVQACTDVYTENLSDLYTIEHQYSKGDKVITVHYTLAQVEARIAQYTRKIKEAETQNLEQMVLDNRKSWLTYWQKKRENLIEKLSSIHQKGHQKQV